MLAFVGVRERKDGEVKLHAYLAQDVGKLHVPGIDVFYKLIPSDVLERINDHQFDIGMLR